MDQQEQPGISAAACIMPVHDASTLSASAGGVDRRVLPDSQPYLDTYSLTRNA